LRAEQRFALEQIDDVADVLDRRHQAARRAGEAMQLNARRSDQRMG
jgi:hypothetical protein